MKYFYSLFLLVSVMITAQAQVLKPYTLGTTTDRSVAEGKDMVVKALKAQGLEVLGTYDNVHTEAAVVVFSSEDLLASVGEIGGLTGFASALKVAVTREDGKTVVSYTTPMYWGNAYFRDDFDKVERVYAALNGKLKSAMEEIGPYSGLAFGSEKGLSPKKLQTYKYMFGMPDFDDTVLLGEFKDFDAAVTHIDSRVMNGVKDMVLVYKVSVPGRDLVLYGFGLSGAQGEQGFMPKIDIGAHKHTAFLPYDILVMNNEVHMLHGRYRIALSFPDLTMGTFTRIMSTPGYIEDTFEQVVME